MRNYTSQLALGIKHNTVRTGASTSVHLIAAQNGELLIWAGHVKVNSLIVVLSVWVVVAADLHSILIVRVALCDSFVDIGLPVAGAAAGVDAGLTVLEEGNGEVPSEGDRNEGSEGELLWGNFRAVSIGRIKCSFRGLCRYMDESVGVGLTLNIILTAVKNGGGLCGWEDFTRCLGDAELSRV